MTAFSSPLTPIHVWKQKENFGYLLKDREVAALYWYTVELENQEVFAFDAQYLAECVHGEHSTFRFSDDLDTAVRQASILAEQQFDTLEAFRRWVRENFYRVQTHS